MGKCDERFKSFNDWLLLLIHLACEFILHKKYDLFASTATLILYNNRSCIFFVLFLKKVPGIRNFALRDHDDELHNVGVKNVDSYQNKGLLVQL